MPYNLTIGRPVIADKQPPPPPYQASFNTPGERLTACLNHLIFSDQYKDVITPEHGRLLEKTAVVVPFPDDALSFITYLCADWGIRVEISGDTDPHNPKRLYSVITQHDNETNVELFSDPYQRRDALIQRINNVRESTEPLPVHLAHDDDKLATVLTALLLPDEIRLAESVWDDRSGFYRHVGFYRPISQQV